MFGSAKLVLILAAVAAILFGAERMIHSHDQAVKAGVNAAYQAQAAAAEAANRLTEQKQAEAQRENDIEAQRLSSRARDAAVGAADAATRLRDRARVTFGSGLASHPSIAGSGPTTGDACGMYADLFGRTLDLARRYAAIADERGIAGQTCERDWNTLTTSP